MSLVKSGSDLSLGEGGWEEARGGREGGEGIEGGAEGAVDGNPERARMGTEGQMPYGAVKRQRIFRSSFVAFLLISLH